MYLKLYKQNYLPLWARGTHTQMHKLCKHPANSRAPSIISTSQEIKFHWAISHWIIFTTLTITCPYKGATHTGTSSHTLSAGWVLSVLRGFLRTASSLMAFVCVCVYVMPWRDRWFVFVLNMLEKMGREKNGFQRTSVDVERTESDSFYIRSQRFFVCFFPVLLFRIYILYKMISTFIYLNISDPLYWCKTVRGFKKLLFTCGVIEKTAQVICFCLADDGLPLSVHSFSFSLRACRLSCGAPGRQLVHSSLGQEEGRDLVPVCTFSL